MKMRLLTALLVLAPLSAAAEWTEDAELCATIVGDSPRAIRHCEAAIASGLLGAEDLSTTWSNLAYELGEMGRYLEAIEASTTAIEIDPQNPRAWANRANDYQTLNRFDEAIADYRKALGLLETATLGPTTAGFTPAFGANRGLAQIYRDLGQRADGQPYAAAAYALEPDALEPDLADWYGLR